MSNLQFVDVDKKYGDTNVLRDINFDIQQGEFIIVVGPSGCGKSSLLRMVAGLETVSDGDIFIGRQRVNDIEPKARDIAMVFQNYALYPHMSVFKNMAYGLRMRKLAKDDIEQKVTEAAKVLKIESLLARKPHELSGGQRQRVAMGRAIVRQPQVFLFDEPLSNLDAKLRMEMRLEIKTLQRRLGVTSLYVTHDQTEAMTMADRIVVLNRGYIEQIDTPLAIYQRPKSMFVAGFMGNSPINFISARLSGGGTIAKCDCGIILNIDKPMMTAQDGMEVMVGVRAEHIGVREDDDQDSFEFHVNMVEAMGADTLMYGEICGTRQALTVRLNGHWPVQAGEVLPLIIKTSSVNLFDKQSGLRVEGVA